MKKFNLYLPILLMAMLLVMVSCNRAPAAAPQMLGASLENTATASPPAATSTLPLPPTDPGCTSTNIIDVPLLSARCVRVTTSDPQLKNTSAETLICTVVGPSTTTKITVNANSTAGFDTTASGAYTLSCTGKNLSVKIEK